MNELVFLKLGGSLITDKTLAYTPRLDKLGELIEEIQSALATMGHLRLVLGHGSGSFGHYAVTENLSGRANPRSGEPRSADAAAYWHGYSEVRYRAADLNRHVMDALHRAGLASIALQPSAMVQSTDGVITHWDLSALEAALQSTLMPVIYGDIVFDSTRGSTVLSTEALMLYLAPRLRPQRILLAGLEAAVWADYPARRVPIDRITPTSYATVTGQLSGSHGTDVTGGMKAKVLEMLELVADMPKLTVRIFSGNEPGNVAQALAGAPVGTLIACD